MGGAVHVILADGTTVNWFCDEEEKFRARSAGDEEGAQLICLLRAMSRTQIIKLISSIV